MSQLKQLVAVEKSLKMALVNLKNIECKCYESDSSCKKHIWNANIEHILKEITETIDCEKTNN
jgi:hypothetical protein